MASILATPTVDFSTSQTDFAQQVQFASFCQSSTWDDARSVFAQEGRRILEIVRSLRPEWLAQKTAISGKQVWSIETVLDYLIAIGTVYAEIVVHLSHDERPWREMDPMLRLSDGTVGDRIVSNFSDFLCDFSAVLTEDIGRQDTQITHMHPHYGRLTAHGWLCLAAFQQRMCRNYVEQIAQALTHQPFV